MKRAILATAVVALAGLGVAIATAADHADAPAAQADSAADLGDLYAWIDDDEIVLILTLAPLSSSATYDDETIYGIHLDYSGDGVAEEDLWVRFGQNSAGDWGVQALIQSSEVDFDFDGPVETVIDFDSFKLWAGNADDPFFFDIAGFQDSLSSGTLSFTGTDGLAGLNATAIVFQAPAPTTDMSVWATSGRL